MKLTAEQRRDTVQVWETLPWEEMRHKLRAGSHPLSLDDAARMAGLSRPTLRAIETRDLRVCFF